MAALWRRPPPVPRLPPCHAGDEGEGQGEEGGQRGAAAWCCHVQLAAADLCSGSRVCTLTTTICFTVSQRGDTAVSCEQPGTQELATVTRKCAECHVLCAECHVLCAADDGGWQCVHKAGQQLRRCVCPGWRRVLCAAPSRSLACCCRCCWRCWYGSTSGSCGHPRRCAGGTSPCPPRRMACLSASAGAVTRCCSTA